MKKLTIIILFLFLGTQLIFAQGKKISGVVTSNEEGFTIPGVNVLVKGTSIGVITDIEGTYEIMVPNDDVILIFSSVGYETQEIPATSQSIINVSFEVSQLLIDEVVVVAYGTTTKETSSGPLSNMSRRGPRDPVRLSESTSSLL